MHYESHQVSRLYTAHLTTCLPMLAHRCYNSSYFWSHISLMYSALLILGARRRDECIVLIAFDQVNDGFAKDSQTTFADLRAA